LNKGMCIKWSAIQQAHCISSDGVIEYCYECASGSEIPDITYLTSDFVSNCCTDVSSLNCQDMLFEGICQESISASYCIVCDDSGNSALINNDPIDNSKYFTQCSLI
jgi:hypothetical protein